MIVFSRIRLLDQNPVRRPVPYAGPRLICPTQTERIVRLPRSQHLGERPLEDALAAEPVVIVAERLDSEFTRQLGLRGTSLRDSEIVKAEVGRNVRLIVAAKQWLRLGGVRPLRKACSPPLVVLGNRMKLREIERDQSRRYTTHQVPSLLGFKRNSITI